MVKRRQSQRQHVSSKKLEAKKFKIVVKDFLVDKTILKSYRNIIDDYFCEKKNVGRRSSFRIHKIQGSQKGNVQKKNLERNFQKMNRKTFLEAGIITNSDNETTTIQKSDDKIVKKKKFDKKKVTNGEINSNDCQKYLDVFELHYTKKSEINFSYVQVIVYSDGLIRVLFNSRNENDDTHFLQMKVIEELSDVFHQIFDEVSSHREKKGMKGKNEFGECRLVVLQNKFIEEFSTVRTEKNDKTFIGNFKQEFIGKIDGNQKSFKLFEKFQRLLLGRPIPLIVLVSGACYDFGINICSIADRVFCSVDGEFGVSNADFWEKSMGQMLYREKCQNELSIYCLSKEKNMLRGLIMKKLSLVNESFSFENNSKSIQSVLVKSCQNFSKEKQIEWKEKKSFWCKCEDSMIKRNSCEKCLKKFMKNWKYV
ncbi:hypothetical protein SNEBB_007853 [Seison nebaliae]|nr:hypothetical protein SNEBB_007853 [Seison nebaliae]